MYSGKIIVKTGHLGDWENHKNLNFKDADLVGVGVYFADTEEDIVRDIRDMVRVMDQVSARDNTPWLITEYYIATPEEVDLFFPKDSVKIPVEDAYRAGLTEFRKSRNAVGFTFTGYLAGGRIRNTPAIPVLKEYYSSQ